jgi:hypothetical protein
VFENIPDRLTDTVRGLSKIVDVENRELVRYGAAMAVVAEYLGKIATRKWLGGFFQPGLIIPEDVGHTLRLIHVGETLFSLRSTSGFAHLCRRLGRKRLRSAFFEMWAAKMLFKAGFEIHARRELTIRKEDFDFWCVRDQERINIEVTTLTRESFSANNIMNALTKKRKQVPDTDPAILFCAIPESWLRAGGVDWDFALSYLANKFLAQPKSERINHVVFVAEEHVVRADWAGGGLMITLKPYPNYSPKNRMRDSTFLFKGPYSTGARHAFNTPDGRATLQADYQTADFFKVGRSPSAVSGRQLIRHPSLLKGIPGPRRSCR